jgi:selenocysteine-specific elongation factor
LTKTDRVEPDHLEIARADVEGFLQGTFLEGAPVLPVSSVTGEGFDLFYGALEALVRAVHPKRIDGVFRLPLDRAFSAKGYGTVVAGIPVSGSAQTGGELVLLPRGETGRIRQIEVYGQASDTVRAGLCAAINVRHWDPRTVSRGDTVAVPGYFAAHQWHACKLRLVPQKKLTLKNGAQVKFHTGTSEVTAAVYPMHGDRMEPGGEYLVQVRTKTPVVAGPGDHFILRTLSPARTVGGGMIIESLQRRLKRNCPNVHEDLQQAADAVPDESRFVEYCVRKAPSLAAGEADLAIRAKVPRDRLPGILAELVDRKRILALSPTLYIHSDTAAEVSTRLLDLTADFHRQKPESLGITLEDLRKAAQMDRTVLRGLVGRLKDEGRLVERDGRLATAEHQATFSGQDAQYVEAIESMFREQEFHPPSPEEISQEVGAPVETVTRLLETLREHGRLVLTGEGLLFHRQAVDHARSILVDFIRKEGKLESVRFKYLLDTSRKFAIPLLDYLDRDDAIRRVGNARYLRTPPDGGDKA